MEKIVLDTHAAAAFFLREPGADAVEHILKEAHKKEIPLLMCAVNYGELFYAIQRKAGIQAAIKVRNDLDLLQVNVVDAGKELSMLAAGLKVDRKMSYADCFVAATAMAYKAVIVTGDKEFKEVEKEIKIIWI